VNSSTGNVQPYGTNSTPENNAANALNSSSRNNTNNNVNLTALGQYKLDAHQDAEIGLARQVRNPNLYELYSWSTSSMNAAMNNFVGDGNGYYGNPNLKPETAYTVSGNYDLHSADKSYQVSFAPYYSYVYNYIGAVQRYSGVGCSMMTGCTAVTSSLYQSQYNILQYVNQNAQLAGADLTGRMPLGKTEYGNFGLKGLLSYTYGHNQSTGFGLYNVMPLNGKVTLTHQTSGWDNALELVAVARKSNIDVQRNEYGTAGYFLANIKGSYTFKQVRVDAGINNVFNTFYSLPLGGAYVGQGQTMSLNGAVPYGTPMPGPGISIYSALTVKF
jgi:iron complex outermembrane receptor protein